MDNRAVARFGDDNRSSRWRASLEEAASVVSPLLMMRDVLKASDLLN